LKKGYVHVYTGPGKGKTTAALGLSIRAVGAGFKVHMVQFMKGRRYSELNGIKGVNNFSISQYGRDEFVDKKNPEKIDIDFAREGFAFSKDIINGGQHDLIILDEINVAVDYNLIDVNDVIKTIKNKPENVEIVLTGRYAHPEIIKNADYVTEMLEIKHPYQRGVESRLGIDY
jgi:cob(I)alamin adenosyltransferase